LLSDFLSANLPDDSQPEQIPDVSMPELGGQEITVEMELPLPMTTVSVVEQTQGKTQHAGAETAVQALSNVQAGAHSEADNRRTQTRYSCRLGTEVYRTGSNVPNHCCLTDLSSGGCYLEVSLPFPSGSSVEILVRTYEMKLRLRGAVQASHPGYGMGVAFELKTKEECENVKKLIDFVAATTSPTS